MFPSDIVIRIYLETYGTKIINLFENLNKVIYWRIITLYM
jgi:hypothetical protein